jgi:hypothetical protein
MMENLHILKIILKDSPNTENDLNIKLFEFLNNNYKEIIDCNYYIQPILVKSSNIDYFIKKNIESTPGLLDEINNKSVTGLNNIIKYIVKICESKSESDTDSESDNESIKYNSQKKSSNESYNNNADLQEYLLNEAFKSDDTIEDPIDLNVVKSKEDEYRLRQEKKNVDPKFSNKIIETVKNNLNNNDNYSIENYNDYQTEYNNLNEEITKTRPVSDYVSDDKDLQKFWENLEEST